MDFFNQTCWMIVYSTLSNLCTKLEKSEFPFNDLYILWTCACVRLCVFYSLALVLPEYNMHYIQANLGDIKQAMCKYQCLSGVVLMITSVLCISEVIILFFFFSLVMHLCFWLFVCLCIIKDTLNNYLLNTVLQSKASEDPLQLHQSLKA